MTDAGWIIAALFLALACAALAWRNDALVVAHAAQQSTSVCVDGWEQDRRVRADRLDLLDRCMAMLEQVDEACGVTGQAGR